MRPYGTDPNRCIYEAFALERFPEGQAPKTEWAHAAADDEQEWRKVLSQDFSNMRGVQKGMKSRGFREPRPIRNNGSGPFRCGDGRYVQFDPSSYRFLPWFAEAAGVSHWGPALLDEAELRKPEIDVLDEESWPRI